MPPAPVEVSDGGRLAGLHDRLRRVSRRSSRLGDSPTPALARVIRSPTTLSAGSSGVVQSTSSPSLRTALSARSHAAVNPRLPLGYMRAMSVALPSSRPTCSISARRRSAPACFRVQAYIARKMPSKSRTVSKGNGASRNARMRDRFSRTAKACKLLHAVVLAEPAPPHNPTHTRPDTSDDPIEL